MKRRRASDGDLKVVLNRSNFLSLAGLGLATGTLFGIGGGFLIVPDLMRPECNS